MPSLVYTTLDEPFAPFLPPVEPPLTHRQPPWRMDILSDLNEIGDSIKTFQQQWPRTLNEEEDVGEQVKAFADWHRLFLDSLKICNDEQQLLRTYKPLLQEIMICSLTGAPLGEDVLLGSDGRAYSPLSLAIHRLQIPREFWDRSPFHPESPEPFSLMLHPCLGYAAKWLAKHGGLLHSEELKARYEQLLKEAMQPKSRAERIAEIRKQQLELKAIEEEKRRMQAAALEKEMVDRFKHLDDAFEACHTQLDKTNAKIEELPKPLQALNTDIETYAMTREDPITYWTQKFDQIVGHAHTAIEHYVDSSAASKIAETAALRVASQSTLATLEKKIAEHTEEIQQLQKENQQLQESIAQMDPKIDAIKIQQAQIQQGINSIHERMRREKKKAFREMIQGITTVVVTIVAVQAIQAIILL